MPAAIETKTVLFADICGSTRLYEEMGDDAARSLVASVLERLTAAAEGHGGRVVKSIGDEILAVFPAAANAVAASRTMHQSLSGVGPGAIVATRPVNIHIGIQEGPVVLAEQDVFGDAVNVAARLVALAKPRQSLTVRQTLTHLTQDQLGEVRPVENTILKGMTGEVEVCEIVWEAHQVTVLHPNSIAQLLVHAAEQGHMLLRSGRNRVTVDEGKPRATLGRLEENDFSVDRPSVSRYHALVEFRRGRYFLVDMSSNGTILVSDAEPSKSLLREESVLEGSGWIGLGEEPDPTSDSGDSVSRGALRR